MNYARKVGLYTLGCKLNFTETSAIAKGLMDEGYERVDYAEVADYYIINTCSVTEQADRKCRNAVRQALRRNPEAKVVVIGCYAQLKPQEIASIPGVNLVLGANEKFELAKHLNRLEEQDLEGAVVAGDIKEVDFYVKAFSGEERTRTFLKVQDGCDYFCTFCTIPLARGRSRSASIDETVAAAREAADTGVKEIVLTGVNTGDFGKTTDGKQRRNEDFFGLIQELEKIEEVPRWRISSIEPNLLEDRIIDFVAQSERFMPHFHIPLQSGSDRMLKLMKRKYERNLYEERVARIKDLMPHACIGGDVIVGFRDETEADFLETYEFLRDLDISYLHVFTYSERANTRALKIEGEVPIQIRRERSKQLRILSDKKKRAFYKQFEGQTRRVLFEAQEDEGFMYGFTDNYIKVKLPYDESLVNTVAMVELRNASPLGYMQASMAKATLS